MDPKPQRSQRPSLLDDDAPADAPPEAAPSSLSDIGAAARPRGRAAPRWLWGSLLALAVLVVVLAWAFGSGGSQTPAPLAAHAHAGSAAMAANNGQEPRDGEPNAAGHAVILPGDPAAATAATVAVAAVPTPSAAADTNALSRMFAPSSAHPAPVRAKPRAQEGHDADVALLTDLLRHVESGTPAERKQLERLRDTRSNLPIEAQMQACPAANTPAGLRCRQKLCAGHAGESPACPAGTPGGLGAVEAHKPGHVARASPPRAEHELQSARVATAKRAAVIPAAKVALATSAAVSQPVISAPAARSPPQIAVAKPAAPAPPAGVTRGVTRGVTVVRMATLEYPVAAARNHTSGYATLEFTVGTSGAVGQVHVVASSPHGVFDDAAMRVIRESKFAPAMKNGQPIAAVARRRIDFSLGN